MNADEGKYNTLQKTVSTGLFESVSTANKIEEASPLVYDMVTVSEVPQSEGCTSVLVQSPVPLVASNTPSGVPSSKDHFDQTEFPDIEDFCKYYLWL